MPAAHTTLLCIPTAAYVHYALLVHAAAGDFIEDDGGEGDYMDLGDDELFGSGAGDEAAAGGKGKKRKGSDKGEAPRAAGYLMHMGGAGAAWFDMQSFICSRGILSLVCHLRHVLRVVCGRMHVQRVCVPAVPVVITFGEDGINGVLQQVEAVCTRWSQFTRGMAAWLPQLHAAVGYLNMSPKPSLRSCHVRRVCHSCRCYTPDASAAKRQAAEEVAKASKNKERLQQMFAKAAGEGHPTAACVY
jgi:hypothetical protein